MKKKKTIKVKFLNMDSEKNVFNHFLKKNYIVIIDDKNPDFIVYGLTAGRNVVSVRGFVSRIPILKKYTPNIRQFMCDFPRIMTAVYEIMIHARIMRYIFDFSRLLRLYSDT